MLLDNLCDIAHTHWQKISVKELDLEAALAERQVCGLFIISISTNMLSSFMMHSYYPILLLCWPVQLNESYFLTKAKCKVVSSMK